MYDNIDFKLRNTDVSGIDFLAETPQYFEVKGEHYFNESLVVTGELNGYKITVNNRGVNIKDNSLCKYHLGDNFKSLGRSDTKQAIQSLSDALHLPIEKATVSRIDIAENIIVQHPIDVYYSHLGELKHGKRSTVQSNNEIEGLYYYQSNGLLVFYNKIKEQKAKGQPIPDLFKNSNVLRYEQRYRKRLPKTFGVERVTGAMLYDERFYMGIIDRWKKSYFDIKKINDTNLNFNVMTTKKDLYTMGVLSLMQMAGGELAMLNQITEAQKRNELTKKQAYDLRQAVTEACKVKEGLTVKSDCIHELDKKIKEAVKFYR